MFRKFENYRKFNTDASIDIINYAQVLGTLSGEWKLSVLLDWSEAPLIDTSNLNDNSKNNSSLDSDSISLIYKKNLFDFFIPNNYEKKNNSMEFLNFFIWDATCHIMGELAGTEQFGFFDESTVSNLAKAALNKACLELGLNSDYASEQERCLAAGVAIWNLLLPESVGGSYPTEEYPKFIESLNGKLQKFWNGCEKEITPVILKFAFLDFKEFAINNFKVEMERKPKQNDFAF